MDETRINYKKLRGRIIEKYGTLSEFAKIFGKSPSFLTKKLSGQVGFKYDEIILFCKLLDIHENDISQYFFAHIISEGEVDRK